MQPRLVIVGNGPALVNLKKLAERLYPQAEFTGALYGEELVYHFIQADLFALPGSGGLAIQEAMGFGLPIIVAKGDGTQDDLVRPENGWQVEPGDLEAFYAALYQALSNLPQLRQKGAESYRIAAREVNIEAMADSFIHALTQVAR
jgi:glycosyltransferase involved in cell wall biosynthesis